jgi:hemolysin activation/secretion protein
VNIMGVPLSPKVWAWLLVAMLLLTVGSAPAVGQPAEAAAAASRSNARRLDIREYRVQGATQLSTEEIEAAVYPYLGPDRTLQDVEAARAALEKRHVDLGYHSVAVAIPPQTVKRGVVLLKVTEAKVGQLRVRGSRWSSLSTIRQMAPSVAEGAVLNFNDIMRDILALNQLADRRVTPELRAGALPGTVDVDLRVKDTFPLHGSLELNNRYSRDTPTLRLNGAIRYDNLWQLGHSLGLSFQLSPEVKDPRHGLEIVPPSQQVFSLFYLARFPQWPWFTLSLHGMLQDSDVSTLDGIAVQGRGTIVGAQATFTLPGAHSFFHSLSLGLDYRDFAQGISLAQASIDTPITYLPLSLQYATTWAGKTTELQALTSAVLNLRALSSDSAAFDAKRFQASGSFFALRFDLSMKQELMQGMQWIGRLRGQYSGEPLIGAEQLMAGGVASVRGYLEAEAAGDWGGAASVELLGPDFAAWFHGSVLNSWRLLVFADGAWLKIYQPLPEQKSRFLPVSVGAALRLEWFDTLLVSVDVGWPLKAVGKTKKHRERWHFRMTSEF